MEITETLYVATRSEWRAWLEKNHATKKGIWLIYYKKNSGKPRVAYDDAVEEALCFGWIDSTVKKLDEDRYCQRFSRRNPGSEWSDSNKMRIKKLLADGKMAPAGLETIKGISLKIPKKKPLAPVAIPADLKKALAADSSARENFKGLTEAYVRLCLRWIDAAKREETRQKRIAEFVELTAQKKKIGMR